jgi:hypothetical protein
MEKETVATLDKEEKSIEEEVPSVVGKRGMGGERNGWSVECKYNQCELDLLTETTMNTIL